MGVDVCDVFQWLLMCVMCFSGRRMTREGRRDLDRIASQIHAKAKKAAAAAALAHVE